MKNEIIDTYIDKDGNKWETKIMTNFAGEKNTRCFARTERKLTISEEFGKPIPPRKRGSL